VCNSTKFFAQWGLEAEEESITNTIMKACLSMSTNFHTPVEFWLGLTLPELYEWISVAKELSEENHG
jgi:hypothetical protein